MGGSTVVLVYFQFWNYENIKDKIQNLTFLDQ